MIVGQKDWRKSMPQKGHISLFKVTRCIAAVFTTSLCFSFSSIAIAQDKSSNDAETINTSKLVPPSEGLNFNLPSRPDFSVQTGPILDLPLNSIGSSSVFKLDLTPRDCAGGGDGCPRYDDNVKVGLTDTFSRHSEKGLDLSLTPRASVSFSNDLSVKAVGAVIEIGEDLREGSEFESNTWYFFAGADAEALTYSPNSVGRITSGQFHLQDRIIVGDAQAGVGYRIGDADVSVSYTRREASGEAYKFVEDAAALSFTWKR